MKRTLLLSLMLALAGCDYFPGPTLTSRLDSEAEVHLEFDSGRKETFTIPPCRTIKITGGEHEHVNRIILTQAGSAVLDLDDAELQAQLIEQHADDLANLSLYVAKDGVYSHDPAPEKCPSPR